MKHYILLFIVAAAAGTAYAAQGPYQQCGGQGWTGGTTCEASYTCNSYNAYYSQCIPATSTVGASVCSTFSFTSASTAYRISVTHSATHQSTVSHLTSHHSSVTHSTTRHSSVTHSTAHRSSVTSATSHHSSATSSTTHTSLATTLTRKSQTSGPSTTSTTSHVKSTTSITSKPTTWTTTVGTQTSTVTTATSTGTERVQYAGINIAGFDFGCTNDGSCDLTATDPPGQAGIEQMEHFVSDDTLNAFRLPVAWQYLLNNDLGGTLDATNFAAYNVLVQGCLSAGAQLCLIDIHNYARWNGGIIGQGGPTNAQYASLWSQLATKYASEPKVAFGIMNEPHDLDVGEWSVSAQAAVTAIRQAGATTNKILIPGSDYTSAADFISDGSGPALLHVTNLDGSTTNLIFDVHKYLDSDNSGTSTDCATNNVAVFEALGAWLRQEGRQAFLSETGGGPTSTDCYTNLCEELATLNQYSDVFLGWLGWAAGSFETSYTLSETPTQSGSTWIDQPLVTKCIVGEFTGASD